ncbi:MAG: hypothetical protein JO009_10880 [Candidatus Eremiobacteraeota bacterium]|nr:hypothetical protein [Candidatus Eremiobacteraeota bacterium]
MKMLIAFVPSLLAAERRDPIVSLEATSALAKLFEAAGALVSIHWHNGGHELGNEDLAAAKYWLKLWPPPV